ncbi:Aspartic proteinase CDR1 [Linum grandiflorum]
MAPRLTPLIFFLFFFEYSLGLKLTTELIHHDSIFSPFYNASETTADRAWRATRTSVARHASFASERTSPASIEARLEESMFQSVFYVKFSIGSPPVPQLAIMDTGSHFLWLKCLPCTPCSPSLGIPYFEPEKSTTFSPWPCQKDCKKCTGKYPWSPKHCMYTVDYTGGMHSEGIYATDRLTFRTANDQTTTIQNVVFGCSTSLSGTQRVDQRFNGVLGLGLGNPSTTLLRQDAFLNEFDYRFSYCTGSLTDPSYPSNRLAFGDAAIFKGKPTPFYLDHFDYGVHLYNISLGPKMLDIDIKVFRNMALRKGVVIDSGSTLIHLYTEAFEVVKAEVAKQASGVLASVPSPGNPYELCYQGRVEKDAAGFAMLGLHFAGGAFFTMDNRGLFRQIDENTFCMAIVRSDTVSLIGIMAQQRYNVAFDLKEKNMYLAYIEDCSVLNG